MLNQIKGSRPNLLLTEHVAASRMQVIQIGLCFGSEEVKMCLNREKVKGEALFFNSKASWDTKKL